jgi:hypothetical protein
MVGVALETAQHPGLHGSNDRPLRMGRLETRMQYCVALSLPPVRLHSQTAGADNRRAEMPTSADCFKKSPTDASPRCRPQMKCKENHE